MIIKVGHRSIANYDETMESIKKSQYPLTLMLRRILCLSSGENGELQEAFEDSDGSDITRTSKLEITSS